MVDVVDGVTVSKIPILNLILVFIGYLVLHIIVAKIYQKKKERLDYLNTLIQEDSGKKDVLTEIEDTKNTVRILGFLYKWFPAIAVIIIVIGFYS